jgi:hypothetical protein
LSDKGGIAREWNQAGIGVTVARGAEKRLPLGGHLLENAVRHRVSGRARAIPGATQLIGRIVGGHAAEDIIPIAVRAGFIDDDIGNARAHRDHHLDIEGDLDFPAIARGDAVESVQQDIGEGDIGTARHALIIGDVAGGVAVKLKQPDGLARTG